MNFKMKNAKNRKETKRVVSSKVKNICSEILDSLFDYFRKMRRFDKRIFDVEDETISINNYYNLFSVYGIPNPRN